MKLEIRNEEDRVRAVINGNIDLSSVDEVRKALDEVGELVTGAIVLDLGGVEFVDSAGLGALVTFYKSQSGKSVTFQNVNERVRKLFHITRLDTLFKIE